MVGYRYRATSNVKLPLKIIATVNEIGTTQVSYVVVLKTNFNNKLSATNVVLRIPTPLNTTSVDCKVQNGKAKYVPGENVVVWKYASFLRQPYIPSMEYCQYAYCDSLGLVGCKGYKVAKNAPSAPQQNSRARQEDKSGLVRPSTSISRF